MPLLDIAIISGRRPELLARTLASFEERLFRHFSIGRAVVNLDPFGGGEADHEACRRILRDTFADPIIIEPDRPSFGMAVKQAWAGTCADHVLHLEDDWLLNEPLSPDRIFPLFEKRTGAVQMVSQELNWTGDTFRHRVKTKTFLGVTYSRQVRNLFGTSPGFWRGDVLRGASARMDPTKDPEKQMRPHKNQKLFDYLNRYRCRMLPASDGGPLITDIGREWRAARRIEKVIVDGVSLWQ